jgi:small-conductance mechanosensitive channel
MIGADARRRGRSSPIAAALALIVPVLLAAGSARAETVPGVEAAPEHIAPEEVPLRSELLIRSLRSIRPDAATRAVLEDVEASLPAIARDLESIIGRATTAVGRAASPLDLGDGENELLDVAAPLRRWKAELEAEARRVADAVDRLERETATWSATRDQPATRAAGEAVIQSVERSLAALDRTRTDLGAWRARVLAASTHVLHHDAAVDAALEKLRVAMASERAGMLAPDRPPVWARGTGLALREELPRIPGEVRASRERTAAYVRRDVRPLLLQALVAALLLYGLSRLAAHTRQRRPTDDAAALLRERPHSVALLIALLASPVLHPLAPRRFMELVALAALVPAMRIVTRRSSAAHPVVVGGFFVVLLLERFRLAVWALPAVERVTFLVTMAVAFALATGLVRSTAAGAAPWARRGARLAAAALALGFAAELGGWTQLAAVVGRGTVAAALAAVFAYAAALSAAALVAYAMSSRATARSHLLGRDAGALRRHTDLVVRFGAAGLLVYFVATALGVRDMLAGAITHLLDAGISVGTLSLSIGGMLAFVLTLAAAFLLARFVNGVLEEDVFPRAHLPRGVPYALSTIVRYAVYALGVVFALAAAGVQLQQVSIVLGGLGIGIGLGLQDIVRNFAAGLTLLLERRVHPGDAIEIPGQGVSGRVLSIGLRASLVRGWSGAESVLPNASLVSSVVTNWTLSDRLCRVEVPVGVASGNDPERVIPILCETAAALECFLPEPPPQAFFKGFGPGSLDFVVRAWTDQGYERMQTLSSELARALHRRLREADVAGPFSGT